ncbi:MAG TPA: hypothetical protein DEP84_07175, partial [Chloroflexi bacterium]|nr:hypothetical protein [Chloroflexota bacterium]
LTIRREQGPPWLGLERQSQAHPAGSGGSEGSRGRAMIRRGPWRTQVGEPADQAGVGLAKLALGDARGPDQVRGFQG